MATYPVVHDHVLGSCRGDLIVRKGHISFASEKGKDSFDMELSNISYDLDEDELILRAASKVFRFKSAEAATKVENETRLLEIFHTISKFTE